MDKSYENFGKEIEKFTDRISLRSAMGTGRKGGAGLRDKLVLGKMAWSEALTYFGILQSMVIFMALVPTAIDNVNNVFKLLDIPFQFPVEVTSFLAVIILAIMFSFGILAYRYLGLPRRTQEVSAKMNTSMYMIWHELQEVKEKLHQFEVEEYE